MGANFQALRTPRMIGGLDDFTKIFLSMEGDNGSTVFTDYSFSPNTFTTLGNSVLSSSSFAAPSFGATSGKFDGTGDYLTCPDSAALRPGTADFTVDFFVRYNASSINQTVMHKCDSTGGFLVQTDNLNPPKMRVSLSGTLVVTETTGTAVNTWVHKAIVRSAGVVTIYSNGVANGSAAGAQDCNGTAVVAIGGRTGVEFLNGNLKNFRYSPGIARWNTTFTPPALLYDSTMRAANIRYLALNANNTGATTYTYTNQGVGVATSDRILIVASCLRRAGNGAFTQSVTAGGTAMTQLATVSDLVINGSLLGLYALLIPSGTTSTVVVTGSISTSRSMIAMWTLTNTDGIATPLGTATNGTNATTMSINLPTRRAGAMLSCCMDGSGNSSTYTWTNQGRDGQVATGTNSHSAAHANSNVDFGSLTISALISGSPVEAAMIGASW